MPENWEYVAAAYGIWAAVFALYALWLVRRSRAVNRALQNLDARGKSNGSAGR